MLNSFRARNNCEQEAKFIQDRIISVEKNLAELCHIFGQYSRKIARVRDKGDELAKVLQTFAENEEINKSLSAGLENFAHNVTLISDYGDLRVQNIDTKVVHEFSRYENICKLAKEETRLIFSAREKEFKRKLYLDRVKERNPRNRQQIVQAETELLKATAEVSKTVHNLEEKTTAFERQKLHDLKSILLDFIAIEMGYHAKALEILTKSFAEVEAINEESDLQELKKSMRNPEVVRFTGEKGTLYRASQSLGSLGLIFSTGNRKIPGIPTKNQRASKSEETLDSMKRSISDTEENHSQTEEDVSENLSESDEKTSPIVVRRYLK